MDAPAPALEKRPSGLKKLKAKLRAIPATTEDGKGDCIKMIATSLLNGGKHGNGIAASDVVAAGRLPPADRWIHDTFGEGKAVSEAEVETILSAAKEQYTRTDAGLYTKSGAASGAEKRSREADVEGHGGGGKKTKESSRERAVAVVGIVRAWSVVAYQIAATSSAHHSRLVEEAAVKWSELMAASRSRPLNE